jgi:hypothetical protein
VRPRTSPPSITDRALGGSGSHHVPRGEHDFIRRFRVRHCPVRLEETSKRRGGPANDTHSTAAQLHDIERAEEKEYKKGMADSPEDEAIRAQFEAQYGDGAVEEEKK